MPITIILQLLAGLPLEAQQLSTLWAQIKPAFSAQDQATVDAIIARLDAKTDADVAQLHADAGIPASAV